MRSVHGLSGQVDKLRMTRNQGRSRLLYALAATAMLSIGLSLKAFFPALFATTALPRSYLHQSRGLVLFNMGLSCLLALAYATLLSCLVWMTKRLRHLEVLQGYLWIIVCFGSFIGACGLSQLMAIVTFWVALYALAAAIKTICVIAAIVTSIVLLRTVPIVVGNVLVFLEMFSSQQRERENIDAKLRHSEENLSLALAVSDGIGTWYIDLPGGPICGDARFAALYGMDAAKVAAGLDLASYRKNVHPDDIDRLEEGVASITPTGGEYRAEYRIIKEDGSERWLAGRCRCVLGEHGTPVRLQGVVVDISERKWVEEVLRETKRAKAEAQDAEEMLRETEESLRLAFVGVNGVGTWEWDLTTNLIHSDKVFAVFYGVDPQSAAEGTPFADFAKNIPPEDVEVMATLVADAIQSRQEYSMEHRVMQADGSTRWVAARARCKYAPDGTPLRFPGVVIDITDRRQIEAALLEKEKQKTQAVEALIVTQNLAEEERINAANALAETNGRFRLLVEGVRDHAIFTINAHGTVTSWNRGAERLIGYAEADILGSSSACLYTQEDRQRGLPELQLDNVDKGRSEVEGWRVRADGKPFWACINVSPFFDEGGEVRGFAVIVQDTTERKKIATALEEARRERLRLQERFLSHVSHELRTPLTAIYFFTSNVVDGVFGELNPDQSGHLALALENVEQLREMVSDLLDITRVDANKLAVEPQHARAAKLMFEARSTCLKDAEDKSIHLVSEADEALPPLWADPARVRQILTNLVGNAIKFTPEHGTVTMGVQQIAEEPDFLRFSVADTGCGIAANHLDVVFERLAQVSDNAEISRSGLGLGLFIASELVKQHGGRIWVESEVGMGSTFFFSLPVFSLARLCAHVLTPKNLALGCATLIAVDLIAVAGSSRAELVPEVQKVLARCVHPGQDVLLPWISDMAPVMTFFIVACTDNNGFSVIASRIGMELRSFGAFAEVTPSITSTTVTISTAKPGPGQVNEVTERFERLIEAHLLSREKPV